MKYLPPYHWILSYYTCKNIAGEISDQNFDEHEKGYARKAVWVEIDKIKDLKFYNAVDSVAIIQKAANLPN